MTATLFTERMMAYGYKEKDGEDGEDGDPGPDFDFLAVNACPERYTQSKQSTRLRPAAEPRTAKPEVSSRKMLYHLHSSSSYRCYVSNPRNEPQDDTGTFRAGRQAFFHFVAITSAESVDCLAPEI
ncbi:hypothetical protein PSPO01_16344 [Paraphaeosphaeria sporulosa]